MTYLNRFTLTLTTGLASLCAATAFASSSLSLDGINPTYMQTVPVVFQGNPVSEYAGGITGSLSAQPSNFFFCVDLRHTISIPGNYSVDLVNPSTPLAPYLQLASPFNMQVAASLLNNANIPSFGTNTDQYTAMQLALWSIVYNWTPSNHPTNTLGTALDVFSAPGVVDPNILSNAFNFLSIAEGFVLNNTYGSSYGNYRVLLDVNNQPGNIRQALLGVTTPEPETYLVMASFLLIGMFAFKRRKLAEQ